MAKVAPKVAIEAEGGITVVCAISRRVERRASTSAEGQT